MLCTPTSNGFADHYPYEKWLFHWEYTLFSDIPISYSMLLIFFCKTITTEAVQAWFQSIRIERFKFCVIHRHSLHPLHPLHLCLFSDRYNLRFVPLKQPLCADHRTAPSKNLQTSTRFSAEFSAEVD